MRLPYCLDEVAFKRLIDVEDGHDVDIVDADGKTTLLFAVELDSKPYICLFANAGANLNHTAAGTCDATDGH